MKGQAFIVILTIAVATVIAIFFNVVGAFILTHVVNLINPLGDKFNLIWAILFIVVFVASNINFKKELQI